MDHSSRKLNYACDVVCHDVIATTVSYIAIAS